MDNEDVFGRESVRGMREDILFDGFCDRDSSGRAGGCCVRGERYVERERDGVLILLHRSQQGERAASFNVDLHTFVLSLFTIASRPSRETFAGRFTAGARGWPSSSLTNCTTMCGEG